MKKQLLSIGAAIVLALSICACTSSPTTVYENVTETSVITAEPLTIYGSGTVLMASPNQTSIETSVSTNGKVVGITYITHITKTVTVKTKTA